MRHQYMQGNFLFRMMSLGFRIRDLLRPPQMILRDVGVLPGMTVLDFGCGPGGFSIAAARLVGPEGLVHAVDIHPLAIRSVLRAGIRLQMEHVGVIHSSALADIPDTSVDVALMYDVLHEIEDQSSVITCIHRLLKADGLLSVSDHYLKEKEIHDALASKGLFRMRDRGRRTIQYERVARHEVEL